MYKNDELRKLDMQS